MHIEEYLFIFASISDSWESPLGALIPRFIRFTLIYA